MKCPKCNYLGFDTGDRCKNCGYDFSLIADPAPPDPIDIDLPLKHSGPPPRGSGEAGEVVLRPEPPTLARARVQPEPSLPLFALAFEFDSDEPLIKLPATPHPPLAVRRTPQTPRLRAMPKPSRPIASAPAFEFAEEAPAAPIVESAADVRARTAARLSPRLPQPEHTEVSGAGPRLAAAAIDHLLLCAIDLAVVYFTLRMAGLPVSDWTALPPAPLLAFLLLVKLSYFCAFTAVGGQTIGKMAARIRVVTTDDAPVDGSLAITRTLAGAVSAALLGLGFLPALVGSERRALHDRVAHTRVIVLPSV